MRELENSIERAVLLSEGEEIRLTDLALEDGPPPEGQAALPEVLPLGGPILSLKKALEGPEKRIIERALAANAGNRKATANMLGVNRTTLFNKMRKYDLLDTPCREDT